MGRVNVYSLADYTLKIDFPAAVAAKLGGYLDGTGLTIGGPGESREGSFLGQIRIRRNTDTWSTQADPTGSWVHSKTLDRTGTVELNIREVSDTILKLIYICQIYEDDLTGLDGMTITIFNGTRTVATANDCMITKVADQEHGETAVEQSWAWTAGQIMYTHEAQG